MRLLRAITILAALGAVTAPAGAQVVLEDTSFARVLSEDLRRLQAAEAECRRTQTGSDGYDPSTDGMPGIDPEREQPLRRPPPPLHAYRVDWSDRDPINYTPSWTPSTYRYTGSVSVRLRGVSKEVDVPPPPISGPFMNDPRMPVTVAKRDSTLTFSYSLPVPSAHRFRGRIRLRFELALTEHPGLFPSTCSRAVQLTVQRWAVSDGDNLGTGENRPYDANPIDP